MAITEIGASAKLVSASMAVVKPLWQQMRGHRIKRSARSGAIDIMGLGGSSLNYRVGMTHPTLQRGAIHSDDVAAFGALVGPSLATCLERGWVDLEDAVESDLGQTMVLVGSPGAESLSRLIFGYRPRSDGLGYYFAGDTLDLPFRWQEDASAVIAPCLRYQANGEVTKRPNWPIVDITNYSTVSHYPETDNGGFLRSDYLLVTKLPNFITGESLAAGRILLSIGGTHGIGTRSIERVLKSSDVLAEFTARYQAGGSQHFQALFEARSIVHDRGSGSNARDVRLIRYIPLRFDDAALHSARESVHRRFTDWASEASGRGMSGRASY